MRAVIPGVFASVGRPISPDPALELLYACSGKNRFIYHYTSVHIALEHVLPSGKLKIGKYMTTNDPKETKDWQFFVSSSRSANLNRYDLNQISATMTQKMKGNANVICFSQDRDLKGNHLEDIFSRGFCKPRMWSQYAGNHSGLCLIFDHAAMDDIIRRAFGVTHRIFRGRVEYKNRSIIPNLDDSPYGIQIDVLERMGETDYIKAHIATHWRRLFFEKCLDWRDEDEYRWFLHGDTQKDLFVNFEKALRGVVFGANCPDESVKKVVELTKHRLLWFERLVWKGCTPWYSIGQNWPGAG